MSSEREWVPKARNPNGFSAITILYPKARCALEAMAVGCAAVLCDKRGLGGMVRTNDVATLREWNFGMRCLQQPASTGRVIREILAYDAADAAAVSAYIRENASLDCALDRYISLYEEIAAEERTDSTPIVPADVIRTMARRAGETEHRARSARRFSCRRYHGISVSMSISAFRRASTRWREAHGPVFRSESRNREASSWIHRPSSGSLLLPLALCAYA